VVRDRNLNADSAFQIFECIFEVAEQVLITTRGHIPDLKFQHHIRPLLAVELDTATRRFCALPPTAFTSLLADLATICANHVQPPTTCRRSP